MTKPVRSPFLPDTKIQFAWDSTSLGYLKTCPRLYQYIMIDGWGSETESIHLRFGQEYHHALENYARSRAAGINHSDSLRDVLRQLLIDTWDESTNTPWKVDEETKAGKYKNRQSLVGAVIDWIDHYADDAAKVYIKKDGEPAVELSFSFPLEWGPTVDEKTHYVLCGHLDRVVNFNDALFVMDHKTTTSTLSSHYFDQWSPSNQMTLYSIAAQVVLDSPVKGVIIDGTQLLLKEPTRFVRGFTFRTPDQVEEWLEDLRYWLVKAEDYAIANYWPMNDTACDKFGGCRFRDICSKSPQVREQFLKSDFTKLEPGDRWNPLKPR